MEAVVLIPLIWVFRYEYEVLIGMSGITGSDLYGELANAICRVRAPACHLQQLIPCSEFIRYIEFVITLEDFFPCS